MLNWIFSLISFSAMFLLLWSLIAIIFTLTWDVIMHKIQVQVQWPLARRIIWVSAAIVLVALIANGNVTLTTPYS